jgi:hypothetical protein
VKVEWQINYLGDCNNDSSQLPTSLDCSYCLPIQAEIVLAGAVLSPRTLEAPASLPANYLNPR